MRKTMALWMGILLVVILVSLGAGQSLPLADNGEPAASNLQNPAAVYCREMGYQYEVSQDGLAQAGACRLPDGQVCDAWAFLAGECGAAYSYCAQQGYQIETRYDGQDGFSPRYAVCLDAEGKVVGSVSELFDLAARSVGCAGQEPSPAQRPDGGESTEYQAPLALPPSSFDWRSYGGYNWLTPIRDQGMCGSCWAFAAVGASEAAHNIGNNNPDLDLDLSEQYLVSDCHSYWGYETCCGGWDDIALEYIRDTGIPDEACMTYVDGGSCSCSGGTCDTNCTYRTGDNCSDRTCSDRCADWSSRLTQISETGSVPSDRTAIKHALIEIGPLSAGIGIGSSFGGYWDGDIYRCASDSGTNHAINIVGYDDAGGYWWIKNSWGTGWGDGGYFKLGYGECRVEWYVNYAQVQVANNPPHTPGNPSPANGATDQSVDVDLSWSGGDPDVDDTVTYDVYLAANDPTPDVLVCDDVATATCDPGTLASGTIYYWYVVATDSHGASTSGFVWTFTTQAGPSPIGPVVYDAYLVDDDNADQSSGNGDGVANCGETVELWVDLLNQGTERATTVYATLSTGSPYVTWAGNAGSGYPNIPGGAVRRNYNDFEFAIAPDTPDGQVLHFDLAVTASNGGPWSDGFDVVVACGGSANQPPYVPGSPTPADGAADQDVDVDLAWVGGDPDADDTVTYDVYLAANDPTPDVLVCDDVATAACDPGTLASGTTYYWYVVATDNHGVSTGGPTWDFATQAGSSPVGPLVYDALVVDDDNADQSSGNGDGVANCGETVELWVDLRNQGTERATMVYATLSTSSPYVTWAGNAGSGYPNIPGGAVRRNYNDFEFVIAPGTPDGHVIHFTLNVTASNGGPWSDAFDVVVVCAP